MYILRVPRTSLLSPSLEMGVGGQDCAACSLGAIQEEGKEENAFSRKSKSFQRLFNLEIIMPCGSPSIHMATTFGWEDLLKKSSSRSHPMHEMEKAMGKEEETAWPCLAGAWGWAMQTGRLAPCSRDMARA